MSELKAGLVGEVRVRVTSEMTAGAQGHSQDVAVLSTPSLFLLMEQATGAAVQGCLPPTQQHVGIYTAASHLAATPVGMEVRARAVLEAVDGNRLVFAVEAHDEVEKVGEGRHERMVVNWDRFLERLAEKKARAGL